MRLSTKVTEIAPRLGHGIDSRTRFAVCSSSCTSDSTAELFDPQGDHLNSAQALTTGRAGHSSTVLTDGTVLLIGGINNGVTYEKSRVGKAASVRISDLPNA